MVHCRLCQNTICAHIAAQVANARVRHWERGDSFRWLPGSAHWWHHCCECEHLCWPRWLDCFRSWHVRVLPRSHLLLTVGSLSLNCLLLALVLPRSGFRCLRACAAALGLGHVVLWLLCASPCHCQ